MGTLFPWLVLGGAMLGLLLLSYLLYHYFTDPQESYWLALVTVMLSLTVSILLTMLIPVDIFVISEGDITSESLHVRISQEHVRNAYLILFSSLLFLSFCLVPHAYFYGEDRGSDDFDRLDKGNCATAFRSTAFFVGFILTLLVISLNFRPGHTESLDGAWQGGEQGALKWLNDLLDTEHKGLNAISFSIACLTLAGVVGWVMYTAYGLAAMPFDWIRGKQSPAEQRRDLEMSIAGLKDKYRSIQQRYPSRDDGSLDLARVKAVDRKDLNRLQREHKNLMQQKYRLEELEQQANSLVQQLLQVLVPFRLMIGVTMMVMSLLVAVSLLLTLVDRLLHSPCAWSCGYTLQERNIYNPLDEIFLRLSLVFPLDFIVLGIFVLYIFAATVFGIVAVGVRFFCFNMYQLKTRKSMPQALLVLCNMMSFVLLALCMALLTIAPDYTAFGSQSDAKGGRCSLDRRGEHSNCQVSVLSVFFTRIAVAMPLFSVAYFFANWAFILVFSVVFTRCLFYHQRPPALEAAHECEEEELGLLSFTD